MGVGSSMRGNNGFEEAPGYDPEIPVYDPSRNLDVYGPRRPMPTGIPTQSYSTMSPEIAAQYIDKVATRQQNTVTGLQDTEIPTKYHICFDFDAKVPCFVTIYYNATVTYNSRATNPADIVKIQTNGVMQSNLKMAYPAGNKQTFDGFEYPSEALSTQIYGANELIYKKGSNTYPIVIVLSVDMSKIEGSMHDPTVANGTRTQITYAGLEPKNSESYQIKYIKQEIYLRGERYEISQIFGISQKGGDETSGSECVICMSDVPNTAILPCRHMCLCSSCATVVRMQAGKCPICRGPCEELLQITKK